MGPDAMIFIFWMLSLKPTFSLSSFTFIKRLFSSSSLYAIRVMSCAYLRLLIFLSAILIPACASSSPAFLIMYSAYKLNKPQYKHQIRKLIMIIQFSSVQSLSHVWLCSSMNCSTSGLPVHYQLLGITQTHVHRVSDAIQPSHPLSSPSSPALNPSQHQSFSNESTLCIRWPKFWSFSFSIIPSKEIPGLISFTMDWLDLLAVQGTLKSLLQNHSSKASVLQCSAFFTVQLSYRYMTTGKTIALTRWTGAKRINFELQNN